VPTAVQRKLLTSVIYISAAAGASFLLFSHGLQAGTRSAEFLYWLFCSTAPLVFAFAYPRFLFATSPPLKSRQWFAIILHGFGAAIATFLFAILASPFWKNPVRDVDSITLPLVQLIVLTIFLVAGLSLLLRNTSSFATFASFLFWPYWLLLALLSVDRFFQETIFRTVLYFLCFLTPFLFMFAAGALSYRPKLAHSVALAGLVGVPWIRLSLRDSGLGNVWLMFNLPDNELRMYPLHLPLYSGLAIFSAALIALAIATAILRLLPSRWQFRQSAIRECTWPAFAASFLLLAIWFRQSVMPYRIPGAVDYSGWPILQILHVEKRGSQFHESCVSVGGYRGHPLSVSFSDNHRRLFQYRFQQEHASGQLSEALTEHVRTVIQSSQATRNDWNAVKPLRAWNTDGWYVSGEGIGLRAYASDKGANPPQEIVGLFNELEEIPRSWGTQSDRKDVCLGFCYDPLSGLGFLYANHRCRNESDGVVCR